jgi:hypothetical protein
MGNNPFLPPNDPGALSPGREYPRFMHHATKPPVMVGDAA